MVEADCPSATGNLNCLGGDTPGLCLGKNGPTCGSVVWPFVVCQVRLFLVSLPINGAVISSSFVVSLSLLLKSDLNHSLFRPQLDWEHGDSGNVTMLRFLKSLLWLFCLHSLNSSSIFTKNVFAAKSIYGPISQPLNTNALNMYNNRQDFQCILLKVNYLKRLRFFSFIICAILLIISRVSFWYFSRHPISASKAPSRYF